jgi:CRISPR-associated protein Cmr2
MPYATLVQFSIGPVQATIEQARSVRDLWTGSYLVSWLTAKAIAEGHKAGGIPTTEYILDSPLVKFHRGETVEAKETLLCSSLPNTFIMNVDGDADAQQVRDAIEEAVRDEWGHICGAVHEFLQERWGTDFKDWDYGWDDQLKDYWEIELAVMKVPDDPKDVIERLGGQVKNGASRERMALDLIGALSGTQKTIRRVRAGGDVGDKRPKCSVTGEDAQMGPQAATLEQHAANWNGTKKADGTKHRKGMRELAESFGERIRESERLGAPALVRRFAWTQYFCGRLGREPRDLRSADTATIAAGHWIMELRKADPPVPDSHSFLDEFCRLEFEEWSGQWIFQGPDFVRNSDKFEGPGEHRDDIADLLEDAKRAARETDLRPPRSYYAVLLMDGDGMGDRFRDAEPAEINRMARALHEFSLETVPRLVREYLGGDSGLQFNQPVYAGGDDVLALLPLTMPADEGGKVRSVFGLAAEIAAAFGGIEELKDGKPATMSAGIAVVHYKEDLRVALDAARQAEREAKNAGKDRTAVKVLKRSGEATTATVRWGDVPTLDLLVQNFRGVMKQQQDGTEKMLVASDRWAYQLREVMDSLLETGGEEEAVPDWAVHDFLDAEFARVVARGDANKGFEDDFRSAWDTLTMRKVPEGKPRPTPDERRQLQRNALTLVQTASFLARGREEKGE